MILKLKKHVRTPNTNTFHAFQWHIPWVVGLRHSGITLKGTTRPEVSDVKHEPSLRKYDPTKSMKFNCLANGGIENYEVALWCLNVHGKAPKATECWVAAYEVRWHVDLSEMRCIEATRLDRIGTHRPMDSRDLPHLRCSANVETNIIREFVEIGFFLRFFLEQLRYIKNR